MSSDGLHGTDGAAFQRRVSSPLLGQVRHARPNEDPLNLRFRVRSLITTGGRYWV